MEWEEEATAGKSEVYIGGGGQRARAISLNRRGARARLSE
jgi:hypothetical protein